MKRKLLFALLASILTLSSAHAELWQGAHMQKAKHASLLTAGQLYFDPSEFMGFVQGIYAFQSNFQGELRLGLGSEPVYFGAFGKYLFLNHSILSMSLWAGFHTQDSFNLDSALIMSHTFPSFEIYFAPTFQLAFDEGDSFLRVGFVPGVSFFVAKNARLYTELVLNIDKFYNAFSAGVRFYF